MSETDTRMRSVIVERDIPFAPEKIWRALTQPQLIEAWLMKADFKPAVGHRFGFRADWGAVDCEVLEVEPQRKLAYTWGDHDLKSVVTWTLTATPAGTRLRMEQSGFRPGQPRYYMGAKAGWPRFIDKLEQVIAQLA